MDSTALVFKNDSVEISYDFYESYQFKLNIYNKTSAPLYIDWGNSSSIIGEQKRPFWTDVATQTVYHEEGSTESVISVSKEERYEIIPPGTSINKYEYLFPRVNFTRIPLTKTSYMKNKNNLPDYPDSFQIKEIAFNRQNTPFTFRCYLAFSTESKPDHEFFIDHRFWVSSIKEMKSDQFLGPRYDENRSRTYYTHPYRSNNTFYIIYKPDN